MEHEAIIRLSIFLGIFGTLSLVEVLNPRRARVISRKKRWFTNWGIILVDTLALRLLALALPLLAVGAAADAHALGLGLFHIVNLPIVVEFILAILVLDFAIWLQHLLTHKIPFLWRLHRVHHADRDMDATTAIRFHPIRSSAVGAQKILPLLSRYEWQVVEARQFLKIGVCHRLDDVLFYNGDVRLAGFADGDSRR